MDCFTSARDSTPFTACLVAGGKSSRMGRDKACIDFGGVPLWQHQLKTLSLLSPLEILISGKKGAGYAAGGHTIVEDRFTGRGPLAGIATLLANAAHSLVLMLAVDMPWMTAAYLRHLIDQTSIDCGIVPEREGFYKGLAAIFPKSALPVAGEILESADHSIQHFVRICESRQLVRIVPVPRSDAVRFKSLNFPSDLPAQP